jgi:hypothetical protein
MTDVYDAQLEGADALIDKIIEDNRLPGAAGIAGQ